MRRKNVSGETDQDKLHLKNGGAPAKLERQYARIGKRSKFSHVPNASVHSHCEERKRHACTPKCRVTERRRGNPRKRREAKPWRST